MEMAVLILAAGIIAIVLINRSYNTTWQQPQQAFPHPHRAILLQWVPFYKKLKRKERQHFEYKVQEFLQNVTVTGVETTINDTDRLLVASSAVIPIFAFPDWTYNNLDEVLLYPSSLNLDFDTTGKDRPILGMVGNGYMERKMILSKRALRQGFQNETDKRNTAIHEFVHLIDKADGATDGIPSVLLERQYTIPLGRHGGAEN
jgi:Mlc titration factor MtfA (ptsG expression regulator)